MLELYNQIRDACSRKDFTEAIKLAGALEYKFKDTGNVYGWNQLPLTGDADVDAALQRLDRYLTGER